MYACSYPTNPVSAGSSISVVVDGVTHIPRLWLSRLDYLFSEN